MNVDIYIYIYIYIYCHIYIYIYIYLSLLIYIYRISRKRQHSTNDNSVTAIGHGRYRRTGGLGGGTLWLLVTTPALVARWRVHPCVHIRAYLCVRLRGRQSPPVSGSNPTWPVSERPRGRRMHPLILSNSPAKLDERRPGDNGAA